MSAEKCLTVAFVGTFEDCPQLLGPFLGETSDLETEGQSKEAEVLELIAVENLADAKAKEFDWCLHFQNGQLTLSHLEDRNLNDLSIDFLSKTLEFRTRRFVPGNEMLCKAVAGKQTQHKVETVLDATAGLGRDSFILALAGYQVSLFERSPIVAALLSDGLQRLSEEAEMRDVYHRLDFTHTDSLRTLIGEEKERRQWDVVYLDPMFPERKKSALVKKEMRIFKTVVGADLDADDLLPAAMSVAKQKVVVKRPKQAGFLNDRKPSHQLSGKTGRFDVYVP